MLRECSSDVASSSGNHYKSYGRLGYVSKPGGSKLATWKYNLEETRRTFSLGGSGDRFPNAPNLSATPKTRRLVSSRPRGPDS